MILVEVRGHGAHGVEEVRHGPIEILMAAGEHDVLLAPLDHLCGIADAVRRGRAGGRDRVVDAVDLEPGRKRRRRRRRHRLRHGEGADALRAVVLAGNVGRLNQRAGRRAAGAHDDAGTLVGDITFFEAAIGDRLLHGDMVPGAALRQEAHGAAVHQLGRIDLRRAPDLAFEAMLGKIGGERNAGFGVAQRGGHFLSVVPNRRDNTQTRYNYPSHIDDLF
ncbi:hypothetical protein RHSP_22591 [Rhizobium freirei PRF 81]|uniref:Uncharacterized protein n=1 Tax=Rhizobium freirei PRF 81 TaxID=363754 RepID=N6UZV2_9HYPH|nr:hypothetical protein RHSP_22591 [Rhizobium freirei PRF 81]